MVRSFVEADWSMYLIYFDSWAVPIGAINMVLLVRPQPITKTRIWANVVPFVVLSTVGVIIGEKWYLHIFTLLVIGYVIAMIIYILIYGHRHEAELKDYYSSLEGRSVRWFYVMLFMLFFLIINYILYFTSKNPLEPIFYYGISFFIWHYAYIHVYRMVMVQEAANDDGTFIIVQQEGENENEDENQNENENNAFLLKLKEVCEGQELYTHADLTRDELAHQMGIGHTAFTLQLKQTTGLTFYDYINQLRIRKATELINEGKMDISSISQQVGYSYRSTFYRAFAAVHGCTPTNYATIKAQ
ncbi:MAG: helix-turn-helix transcriptional regulator [Bacteroidales bacterium]|nr:helix-turn-helix transcriptional regulator [Bacteroidales bacterium]